ncbi:Alpha/beta hydrolase fold-1 [Pseudomassariella vexata]|uniref:Alpha/beta hydrolase fold-1 n=1 Tax=Pseudomassariella vexata TaxID=1141098 RepID=A0A1Y2DUP5_9PEZI|nr:Alpha/beta hydrolase fold-1 [Pseudomassariella vexata]ORY63002.1 Alpha/beta hydrolase fold-1 [Pseudomassariella vexata]
MSSTKPIILLVHGAWHLPLCYDLLKEQLNHLGYEFICPALATLGDDKQGATWQSDVKLIREVVIPLFDEGKEVVIVAHSYGGIPASAATQGLGIKERAAEGKTGGFRRLVYMASGGIMVRGQDFLQGIGGSWLPFHNAAVPYTKNQLITVNEKAKPVLYNDLSEAEAETWFKTLVPHSQDAFETGCDFIMTDITIPKSYLITELDQGIPVSIQELITTIIPGFKVERIQTGHSPFLSKPEECARLLAKIAEEVDE